MRSEMIEWVIERASDDRLERHSEGAQTVFSKSRAEKILKKLGPSWSMRNVNETREEN